ncbi:MAG TPA: DUF1343 domain-containing protein [Peptococcaceae bacterium]|jgi:uncharacterized protein YbbC (DUF1343 family)|nr:DUF1343 domain-containing protein [Peptococcaceae bacterium]HPZ70678.1 DUF1343 domain-containing protein [Peptococcaceae bacterium]HQD54595.1 DUF1343 domain-containing protein [Peptococcaceae bacterium]
MTLRRIVSKKGMAMLLVVFLVVTCFCAGAVADVPADVADTNDASNTNNTNNQYAEPIRNKINPITGAVEISGVRGRTGEGETFKLGNEVLLTKYRHLLDGKKVGLVTNQTGLNSKGESTIDVLARQSTFQLTALYGPEHGIDGQAAAGAYVASYVHPQLGIPVYSLYGATRMPTAEMLQNIDVLLYDIQDIGARTYTYISTLNYCMKAAQQSNKTVIVLDRPNPLGGLTVDGMVLEEGYETFVGVDNLPTAHGMTIGELALFFNREIGADVIVIPMEGYSREMIWQDTGLTWVPTSPNVPDIDSVFGYMSTGLGEGTGIFQSDKFKWIGGKGINAEAYAKLLNEAGLPGVTFIPEYKGSAGGVKLSIQDYRTFNPAKTGIYALAYARSLNHFKVPKSGKTMVMFDKIMGTNKIGQWLEQGLTPQQIEANYLPELNRFKAEREKYLIYGSKVSAPSTQPGAEQPGQADENQPAEPGQEQGQPGQVEPAPGTEQPGQALPPLKVIVQGENVVFDSEPYIDGQNRLMVPVRAILEALGATVDWDEITRTVSIQGQGHSLLLTIDSKQAVVDGQKRTMDTTPVIRNSRTMLPARYVGEYLGFTVQWDEKTRTVTVE